MKICDIAVCYASECGGIRTYIDEKQKYIQSQTIGEHMLIAPGEKDNFQRHGRASIYHVSAPPVPGNSAYRFIFRFDKVLSILNKEKPNIIELDSMYLLPWIAFLHRYLNNCKIIGYYHSDIPDAYVKTFVSKHFGNRMGGLAKDLVSQYLRLAYNKCDGTITSSRTFFKKLLQLGTRHVHLIPLGVDLATFHPQKRDMKLRKQIGVEERGKLLVYAGRFDKEKKIEVIVEAFKKLPRELNCSMMFIGEGPLKAYLQDEEAHQERMHVIPVQKDKEELARYLASSDIYVTAGPYETFGLSVIEAQACGLPIVGVKSGALIERVSPTTGVLGQVDSAEEISHNIQWLIQNNYHKKGIKARQLVETNYSWEHTFEKTFILYQNILINSREEFLQTVVNPAKV